MITVKRHITYEITFFASERERFWLEGAIADARPYGPCETDFQKRFLAALRGQSEQEGTNEDLRHEPVVPLPTPIPEMEKVFEANLGEVGYRGPMTETGAASGDSPSGEKADD